MAISKKALVERICAKTFKSSLTCSIFGFTFLFILYLLDWSRIARFPPTKSLPGLDVERAWNDLKFISLLPHPYNSKQNEVVRDYLLDELRPLEESNQPYVTVIDDLYTNITFELDNKSDLVYFEGNNILIHFQGKNRQRLPILLSAHYDSVSTGKGTTDDGMGVAATLELCRYYAKHQPERDLIVNFNNAEEDYLYGARAFAAHELSKNVTAFVNLEGAGSGGKAMLFRSSNHYVTKAYFRKNKYPLASILGSDFFKRRIIRSETDYIVYENMHNGTAGLDIAFYENRNIYHTAKDDLSHVMPKSLRHMMYSAFRSVNNLLDEPRKDLTKFSKPTFFLLFGKYWQFKYPLYQMTSVVLVVVCPIILLSILLRFPSLYTQIKKKRYMACFLLSCVFVFVFDAGTVLFLTWYNPYLINAHSGLVSALFYLTNLIALAFSFRTAATHSKLSSEDLSCIEIVLIWYVQMLWYAVFFISVVLSLHYELSSTYWVTLSYLSTVCCCILTLIRIHYFVDNVEDMNFTREERSLLGVPSSNQSQYGSVPQQPLIHRPSNLSTKKAHAKLKDNIWSVLYFIFIVPLPLFLCYDILNEVILPAGSQTLTDAPFSNKLYKLTIIIAFFSMVNSGPFIFRALSKKSTAVLTMLWITLLVQALFLDPFDETHPLKLATFQTYNLNNGNHTFYVKNITPFTDQILQFNPYYTANGGQCDDTYCSFESVKPSFEVNNPIVYELNQGKHQVDLTIRAESKWCTVNFNESVFVEDLNENRISKVYKSIRMGQREFLKPYTLNLTITEPTATEITCSYDDITDGTIPAYENFLQHLPAWSVGTKASTGLLKVSTSFTMT
ncbi:aminopeptidase [Schizosaccharomyces octosporus yFS286]|uniref:Peptide hydrolase n=1 Tax=Schizosaccharomyces octosporus (strain yFS286) TaxID=483514 RepID=S9R595_SCHOY|nr:aminopeptidase [Schizosaccharomyces octosporus yFS286]EPX73515.1 aminopeptidase [Schizosaccharomyces octosporus yFS286]